MQRKGLEDFARASRSLPDVEFVLAGRHVEPDAVAHLRATGGANLRLPGFLTDAGLEELLTTSSVYLQLSRHEAFGCSVAEAMLHGCTPVLTRAGALPEVAADAAYYANSHAPEAVAASIRDAIETPKAHEAWSRITEAYPASARREALIAAVRRELRNGEPS